MFVEKKKNSQLIFDAPKFEDEKKLLFEAKKRYLEKGEKEKLLD